MDRAEPGSRAASRSIVLTSVLEGIGRATVVRLAQAGHLGVCGRPSGGWAQDPLPPSTPGSVRSSWTWRRQRPSTAPANRSGRNPRLRAGRAGERRRDPCPRVRGGVPDDL